jgi:hypothetical protein
MLIKDYYNKEEGDVFIKEFRSSMRSYAKEKKNVFDWLLDQSDDFLRMCSTEKSEIEKDGKVSFQAIMVLMAIECHNIQNKTDRILEDDVLKFVNIFIYLAAMAHFVHLDWIEVDYQSKWMNPNGKIGLKMTESGKVMGQLTEKFIMKKDDGENGNNKL